MSRQNTPRSTKKQTRKVTNSKQSFASRAKDIIAFPFVASRRRIKKFQARRPHRSFRRTRRRDYVRSLKLPGYIAFTSSVFYELRKHGRTFFGLVVVGVVLTALLTNVASQDTYTQLNQTLKETGGELFGGNWGQLGKAAIILAAEISGTFEASPSEAQAIFSVLIGLVLWLTTIWLLRSFLAGQKPRLRDGLYNSGAPLLPMILVSFLIIVQLIPAALAAIGFSAGVASGILNGGVEAMLFWVAAALLVALSCYWLTGTLFALVVATLPGMYPMRAIMIAGDLVVGRRVRIMLRLFWLLLTIVLGWVVVMVPLILLDLSLKSAIPALEWLPTVPFALLVMGALTTIWSSAYVYMLYRKVVNDDAAPA